jgi:hypothetical protein
MYYISPLLLQYDNVINHQAVLNQNKIAWWLGLPNTSGGKYFYDLFELNNGTLTNVPPSYGWASSSRPCSFANIKLSGNGDYVSISDSSIFKFGTSNFSISGWFNLETLNNTNSNGRQTVISRYESASSRGFSIDVNTSGSIIFKIQESAVSGSEFSSSSSLIAINTWYHFVAVRQGINSYLYVNGKLVASGTSAIVLDISSSTQDLLIGEMVTNSSEHQYFQGSIDDISIYNIALGTNYPQRIYNESQSDYPTTLNRFSLSKAFPLASPWLYYTMLQNAYGVAL